MRVLCQYPANIATGFVPNIGDVIGQQRSRVYHGNFTFANEVGVGTRPRHHRRIGGNETPDPVCELGEGGHNRTEFAHGNSPGLAGCVGVTPHASHSLAQLSSAATL